MKKVIKLLAVIVGLFLAGLAYLQYHHIASINWNKLQQISEGTITTLSNAIIQIPGFDRKVYLKQIIRIILFNATADKYYDPENLFRLQFVERLKELVHPSELKELKEFLMKIRENVDLSIRQLPD